MRINEIFYSLQGEGFHAGTPAVFIRFSGCNLKCSFCDTSHEEFTDMCEEDIMRKVAEYPVSCQFDVEHLFGAIDFFVCHL